MVRLQDETKAIWAIISRLKQGTGFKDAKKAQHIAELLEAAMAGEEPETM